MDFRLTINLNRTYGTTVLSSVKYKVVGIRYRVYVGILFLAPTGALEEGILCVRASVRVSVRDIIQIIIENEF